MENHVHIRGRLAVTPQTVILRDNSRGVMLAVVTNRIVKMFNQLRNEETVHHIVILDDSKYRAMMELKRGASLAVTGKLRLLEVGPPDCCPNAFTRRYMIEATGYVIERTTEAA